jgi:hypothetical protein
MSDEEDLRDLGNQNSDGLEQDADQDEDMDVGSSSKHLAERSRVIQRKMTRKRGRVGMRTRMRRTRMRTRTKRMSLQGEKEGSAPRYIRFFQHYVDLHFIVIIAPP